MGQPGAASGHGGTAATLQGTAQSDQRNGHHSSEGKAANDAIDRASGARERIHFLMARSFAGPGLRGVPRSQKSGVARGGAGASDPRLPADIPRTRAPSAISCLVPERPRRPHRVHLGEHP